jgi:hypothetical protein
MSLYTVKSSKNACIKGVSKVIKAINNNLNESVLGLPKVFRVIRHIGGGGGGLIEFKKGEGLLSILYIETWTRHMAPSKIEPTSIWF